MLKISLLPYGQKHRRPGHIVHEFIYSFESGNAAAVWFIFKRRLHFKDKPESRESFAKINPLFTNFKQIAQERKTTGESAVCFLKKLEK
jgi:hypothetical protein